MSRLVCFSLLEVQRPIERLSLHEISESCRIARLVDRKTNLKLPVMSWKWVQIWMLRLTTSSICRVLSAPEAGARVQALEFCYRQSYLCFKHSSILESTWFRPRLCATGSQFYNWEKAESEGLSRLEISRNKAVTTMNR
jgi:hypothetical protein